MDQTSLLKEELSCKVFVTERIRLKWGKHIWKKVKNYDKKSKKFNIFLYHLKIYESLSVFVKQLLSIYIFFLGKIF